MQRISSPYTSAALPAYAAGSTAPGYFQDGDPAQGTPGTIVSAAFLNGVQEEIGGVIEAAGFTLDGADNGQLLKALRRLVFQTVYPVGSVYTSLNSTDPAQLFGGRWERLRGRFLLAADDKKYKGGASGGSETHTLTAEEMPAHRHTVTVGGGSHDHQGTAGEAGGHTHTRGSMEITGRVQAHASAAIAQNEASGAFSCPHLGGRNIDTGGGNSDGGLDFNASRGWTGETSRSGAHTHSLSLNGGAHSHDVTVEAAGGGRPHDIMPPYLAVFMWKRVA